MPREPRFDRTERLGRFLGDFVALKPFATPAKLRLLWYGVLVYAGLSVAQILVLLANTNDAYPESAPLLAVDLVAAFAYMLLWLGFKLLAAWLVLGISEHYFARHSERFRAAE